MNLLCIASGSWHVSGLISGYVAVRGKRWWWNEDGFTDYSERKRSDGGVDRVSDEVSVRCNYQTEKRSSIIITIGHRAPRAVFSSCFFALKAQTFKNFSFLFHAYGMYNASLCFISREERIRCIRIPFLKLFLIYRKKTTRPNFHSLQDSVVTLAFAFVTFTPSCFALATISTLFFDDTAWAILGLISAGSLAHYSTLVWFIEFRPKLEANSLGCEGSIVHEK